MNTAIILLLLMFAIMINLNTSCTVQPKDDDDNESDDKEDCHKGATFSCCEGYILEVQNETTANCIECIPAGQSCYQINRPCCPGYQCSTGPAIYVKPRPTDICISSLLKG
ncbi:unnamed protein product [Rotaria magnacalcarata]|uniref:Uncharacterized protein n=2 Tax=Rotaria magnacalcarata TaxID=392030 RepID=A0A815AXA8_9BILA|nr:unnamed protein product [Rotaria magnacalcarata]CAF2135736.1 unnamed protein product [Rotaria magnacalcarata]CAF4121684.1 unnamed protein product [Rotaria magnacalcarata]